METFNTLMLIFVGLLSLNVVLSFFLWRSTKSKLFGMLVVYWASTLMTFFLQRILAISSPPLIHAVGLFPGNFILHASMGYIYSQMMEIRFSLKTYSLVLLIGFFLLALFVLIHLPSVWLFVPLSLMVSLYYIFLVSKAILNKKHKMNFSQKSISILLVAFALHLNTYAFFQKNLELLAVGFAVALALLMGIAILLPVGINEKLVQENLLLNEKIALKAKLTQSAKIMAIGEMAEGIAHEINNPLMFITLMLERARHSVDNNEVETLKGQIDRCQKSAYRMSKIVKGLLIFSNEDESEEFNQVSGQEIIESTLELCEEKIKKHEIDLKVLMPEAPVMLTAQKTQLSQVLLNLINNAFDAVETVEMKWILLELKDLGNKVRFSVSDSGKGFSEEAKAKLFQPFFTTKDIGKGTGLGLSIAHGIIERHKGTIAIETHSTNTCMAFTVPKTHPV